MEHFNNASKRTDAPRFTHLKVYSSYSLGVGLNTPAEICAHASRMGYPSIALTDMGGTYGFVEFHLAAKRHGIKPIYGTVVQHYPLGVRGDERFELTLIAATREGLRHLAALASFSMAAAETDAAVGVEVLGAHAKDVVAFVGAAESEIATHLLRGDEGNARRVVGTLAEIFADRLFVEIQDHGASEERAQAGRLVALAAETRTAPLLTHEVRYLEKGMRDLYGTLSGIRHPGEERDFFRLDRKPGDWSMRSPLEMSQLRPFYEAAHDNTQRVDEMVPGDLLDDLEREWVEEDLRDDDAIRKTILERCDRLWGERFGRLSDTESIRYRSILDAEIDQAVAEGLGPRLLLFDRILSRLRESKVDLGPATGLSLQSLCAYLLGITCFDPYHYDTRFAPAFDSRVRDTGEFELQVTGETRSDAAHALFTMFGFGEVAYLPAIERVTAPKAVRMAASVVGVPEAELAEIQDIVGRAPGVPIEKLYEQNERLRWLYLRSLTVRDLLRRAALLEDLPIGIVRSRRSLAVSPVPLSDFLGYSIDSETGDLFLQSGRDDFPFAHVLRVDVTSLSALRVAERADSALREAKIADYAWDRFPVEDDETWRRIQKGDATGVFLFEGPATLQRRESFEFGCIENLTNFLALMRFRDGDQSLAQRFDAFCAEDAGTTEGDDVVATVLRVTRGHVLYHEQLHDIICALTGKSPFEAWKLVHGLRTRSPGALAAVRTQFMAGAAEQGVSMDVANRWFERLLQHSKATISHKRVFADALLVYKLFFLKTHHEAWFNAALLDSSVENEGKFARYLARFRAGGVVLDADVNRSDLSFTVEDGKIRTGLTTVRGLDREKAERVIRAREKGKFGSLEEFVRRLGSKHVTREDVRVLIEAGAFDSLGVGRADLAKRLSALFGRRKAKAKARANEEGQLELPLDG